jgi:hypothetical protein
MKLSKIVTIVGIFFLIMQFSTVQLFNYMMTISKSHTLPTDKLEHLQITVMNVILFSLIGFGIMFMVLLAALIRNAFKQHTFTGSEPAM